jgi:hypothetical protein
VKIIWPIAAALTLLLLAAACSGDDAEPTTTTVLTTLPPVTTAAPTTAAPTTTTTTAPATTTTTKVAVPTSPLNALEVEDAAALDRRVIAVKIDNHPDARPQSGLQEADAVYELIVEGGLTRFIALFQQTDSEYIGPIRSLRPTDPTLVKPLGATLQISGGQSWIRSIASRADVRFIQETSPNTFRIPSNGRARERTLFGSTDGMRTRADQIGAPDVAPAPWFVFGEPTPSTTPARTINIDWSQASNVTWAYNGDQYLRYNGTRFHNWEDADGTVGPVKFDTLLVLTARQYTAVPPGSGRAVPALDAVGTGEAMAFYDGTVVEGTWARDDIGDPFVLTTTAGAEVVLPPGRLWVSVVPRGRPITWE